MALFKDVVEAFMASREFDQATLSRLASWVAHLGSKEITTITPEDIVAALVKLAERGRLVSGKRPDPASGFPAAIVRGSSTRQQAVSR
jgi:hypothetical protein